MSTAEKDAPPLASLVRGGDTQTEAVAITDFIFMARDISNAYLVTTGDGDILVNAGFMDNAQRTKGLLDPVRSGPLRHIILTQAHADHYGGVPDLREDGTTVIAERRFMETRTFFEELGPFLTQRSGKLWQSTLSRGAKPPRPPQVVPDILVDRSYGFDLGGRRFELISTPGGEAPDSLVVWMPKERVVFTGNLFGPVFLSMPFLCTIRGDKPRSVDLYLDCLDRVRALGADLLVTGHGEPIRGADRIRADLDRMYAAVSYVREETIKGMNAGKDVYTLMREIQQPEDIAIGEYHGKVSWNVRSIWEGYAGWFHYDSTTALYDVPRPAVDADLAELAGGASVLAARAKVKLEAGRPLEAMHLIDIALGAEPDNQAALAVKKSALEKLLAQSGGTNLSEVMWLKSEIGLTEAALGGK